MARLLVVDDELNMRRILGAILRGDGHDLVEAASVDEARRAFASSPFDLVVTDQRLPDGDGLSLLASCREVDPTVPVVLITAYATVELAVDAMRQGAFDVVPKPFVPEAVRAVVTRACERTELLRENERLRGQVRRLAGSQELVGDGPEMGKLRALIARVAPTGATVLVSGETGTGKELVARAIHAASGRAGRPFVAVNCAGLSETLLESELFGHERGAFTGAVKRKLGRFELADEGTLFLDEIGELPLSLQAKLLRLLQEHEFQRVGGEETLRADVRVVAATNRELAKEAEAGRFRQDLYYRIAIVPLRLPPLRERPGDVRELAEHFVRKHAPRVNRKVRGISEEAHAALARHGWPGNVRELENAIERALVFAEGDRIEPDQLPELSAARGAGLPVLSGERALPELLEEIERQLIAQAYERAKGKKTETARLLGIKTSALYYKLEKYGFIAKGAGGGGEAAD